MQPARAAERNEGEVGRIATALERHPADRALEVSPRNRDDRFGRLAHACAEPSRDPPERAPREIRDEDLLAAEEAGGVQVPQDEVGVGKRRLLAAGAVARRPRQGPRAPGPHAQRARPVDPRDRTAAGAHGLDVDQRDPEGNPVELGLGRSQRLTRHERHVARGATHVEGHEAFDPRGPRRQAGANHARGRAREDRRYRPTGGLGRARAPTAREHDPQLRRC